MLIAKIKFLNKFVCIIINIYLLVRHFIKNGEQNAPTAAPIVKMAIISPFMNDC
jgi:hypothetical protein